MISFGETTWFARPGPTQRANKERLCLPNAKRLSVYLSSNSDAAGIGHIGATQIFVAVPSRRPHPRTCPMFSDLHCGSGETGRLACTMPDSNRRLWNLPGVYWIPLFQILEKRGIDVPPSERLSREVMCLEAKTDVEDRQWIQHLHSVGLLRGSSPPGRRDLRASVIVATLVTT